eukprot:15437281-Alexandrium_andersonii.AAC.1
MKDGIADAIQGEEVDGFEELCANLDAEVNKFKDDVKGFNVLTKFKRNACNKGQFWGLFAGARSQTYRRRGPNCARSPLEQNVLSQPR